MGVILEFPSGHTRKIGIPLRMPIGVSGHIDRVIDRVVRHKSDKRIGINQVRESKGKRLKRFEGLISP